MVRNAAGVERVSAAPIARPYVNAAFSCDAGYSARRRTPACRAAGPHPVAGVYAASLSPNPWLSTIRQMRTIIRASTPTPSWTTTRLYSYSLTLRKPTTAEAWPITSWGRISGLWWTSTRPSNCGRPNWPSYTTTAGFHTLPWAHLIRPLPISTKPLALQPGFAAAYYNRASAYNGKGELSKVLADLTHAIRLQPDYAEAYFNRGNTYFRMRDYDKAIADLDNAVRLQPDFAAAYSERGMAYLSKGEADKAIENFDFALQLQPNFTKAYNNRGAAHCDLGEYDAAIADFDRAVRLQPDLIMAYVNRAMSYVGRSDRDSAIADIKKSVELGDDPDLQKWAQRTLAELGAQ